VVSSLVPLRLVFVGSLIPRKNVAYILTSLKYLYNAGVDFIFTVVGAGEGLSCLQSMVVESGLAGRVRFPGEVSPLEVAGYLNAADIYISASLHEGRPNSVLEAMSAGCCCVLSDISGHRELVEGGRGYLFSPDEPLSLVNTFESLTAHDVVRAGVEAGKYIKYGDFSWAECSSRYRAVFDKVLNHTFGKDRSNNHQ